jgi:hypothetical protein
MKKHHIQALREAYNAGKFSGRIIQTKRKNTATTPIFKAMEEEKQLSIFNIK